jgi:hypothetical protein
MRSNIPSCRIDRIGGSRPQCRTAAHAERTALAEFLEAGDLRSRRRVVLTSSGTRLARSSSIAVHVVPASVAEERERAGKDQRPRSLRRLPRGDGGRARFPLTPMTTALSEADGVHDGLKLGRSIIHRANLLDRVRQPDPALSNSRRDRTWRAAQRGLDFRQVQNSSMWLTNDPATTRSIGPSPNLIRQAEIAARCVRGVRHGMSVIDADARTADYGRLRAAIANPHCGGAPGPLMQLSGQFNWSG